MKLAKKYKDIDRFYCPKILFGLLNREMYFEE